MGVAVWVGDGPSVTVSEIVGVAVWLEVSVTVLLGVKVSIDVSVAVDVKLPKGVSLTVGVKVGLQAWMVTEPVAIVAVLIFEPVPWSTPQAPLSRNSVPALLA